MFFFGVSVLFLLILLFLNERVRKRGTLTRARTHTHTYINTHTHTHLRIEDSCSFCNTTVLNSTHIDCTIYSSLYSEIQLGLNFTPCSGMALLAWKNEHGEEKHTVHIMQPYTQHNLHSLFFCWLLHSMKPALQSHGQSNSKNFQRSVHYWVFFGGGRSREIRWLYVKKTISKLPPWKTKQNKTHPFLHCIVNNHWHDTGLNIYCTLLFAV